VDLSTIIILIILLALIYPLFKGLMRGLRASPKVDNNQPHVEINLKGASDPSAFPDINFSPDFLSIPSLDFFGQGSKSPDGKYCVGYQDFDYRGSSIGGHRDRGLGRVVLLDGEKIVWQVEIERPNDAVVANNGTVAVNDWKFGDGLKGTFYIINRDGKKFGYNTKANLGKCGISHDGSLAWCNTFSSKYEPDDCMTFIFSTSPAMLLFKLDGNLEPTDINFINNAIYIEKRGIIERYEFSGNLLNPEEVEESFHKYTLEHGGPFELIDLAQSLLYGKEKGKITEAEALEIKNILDRIVNFASADDYYKARAYRLLGELAEAQGDLQDAINHYRTALTFNPKVGVIRALSRLEKRISSK
jgi:hypothetical protein